MLAHRILPRQEGRGGALAEDDTFGAPKPSASVKSRPAINGIRAVAKYPGDGSRTATTGSSDSFISGAPSTATY